jgi:hypothetical protein
VTLLLITVAAALRNWGSSPQPGGTAVAGSGSATPDEPQPEPPTWWKSAQKDHIPPVAEFVAYNPEKQDEQVAVVPKSITEESVAPYDPWVRNFLFGCRLPSSSKGETKRTVVMHFRTQDGRKAGSSDEVRRNVGDHFQVKETLLLNGGYTVYLSNNTKVALIYRDRQGVLLRGGSRVILAFKVKEDEEWELLSNKLLEPHNQFISLPELVRNEIEWSPYYGSWSMELPVRAVAACLGSDPTQEVRHYFPEGKETIEVIVPNSYLDDPKPAGKYAKWQNPPPLVTAMLPLEAAPKASSAPGRQARAQ